MKNRVALIRCPAYDLALVEDAVREAIALLGGISAYVRPGQRVLLKPNMVRGVDPDRAVSTHPTIVAAVAKLVIEAGGHPLIVESPGGPYSPALLRTAYRRTGMTWAAEVSGAELNFDCEGVQVSNPQGQVLHRLDVVRPLLEADLVINLPKLKTHNLTGLTLAVKNLFGLVPGALKIGYHAKLQQRERFCQGLLDILLFVKPALHIMDAVVAMEGEGPSGGDPRKLGAIIAGADALAVDLVCAALVGFEADEVLTTKLAIERGLTSGDIADLELLGEPLETLRVDDFRRGVEAAVDPGLLPRVLRRLIPNGSPEDNGQGDARGRIPFRAISSGWLWRQLVAYPYAGDGCTGCGFCARHCPVQAIKVIEGRAHMDTKACIRCYCCHELCPETAVKLHKPLLGRVLMGS
ncbi:MAG: DUF362 domain-containing protein [Chloroflexi bacterium]|nr:DUF362 domain-containing protein [Chloroflexota bacterium]